MLDTNGIACVAIAFVAALIAEISDYADLVVVAVFIAVMIAAHLIMPYSRK